MLNSNYNFNFNYSRFEIDANADNNNLLEREEDDESRVFFSLGKKTSREFVIFTTEWCATERERERFLIVERIDTGSSRFIRGKGKKLTP